MNTSILKYALEIERTHSISQAAKALNMAQPNLSKAMRELEESLGFKIFVRNHRGVMPTSKGEVFLDYARKIMAQLDNIQALGSNTPVDSQKFSVATSRGSYISGSIAKFCQELDLSNTVDVDIHETNSMDVINSIVSGRNNIGVIRYRQIYEQYFLDFLAQHRLASEVIWDYSYLVIMSRRHALADVPNITPDMLEGYTEIVHGDTTIPFRPANLGMTEQPAAERKRISLYERCNQFELLSDLPTTYMWGSPIPQSMLDRYDLIQRKCDYSTNSYKDLIIYPIEYRLTPLEKRFVRTLCDTVEELKKVEYK